MRNGIFFHAMPRFRKQLFKIKYVLLLPVIALLFFMGKTEAIALPCVGTYSTSLSGTPITITLNQITYPGMKSLSGNLLLGNTTFNVSGFIDSRDNCFVWVWYNNLSGVGSGVLAGKLTETTTNGVTTGTFDFGGGQNSNNRFEQIVFTNMQKTDATSPATIARAGVATESYSGTYSATLSGSPLTVSLTQADGSSGTMLEGELLVNGITLTVGGFVDANNQAYVMAWFIDNQSIGSGVLGGKLTRPQGDGATTTSVDFGGGQTSGGLIGRIRLAVTHTINRIHNSDRVIITPADEAIRVGETVQLVAATVNLLGNPVQLVSPRWVVQDEAVATVNSTTGLVTARGLGRAWVGVIKAGESIASASHSVTVTDATPCSESIFTSRPRLLPSRAYLGTCTCTSGWVNTAANGTETTSASPQICMGAFELCPTLQGATYPAAHVSGTRNSSGSLIPFASSAPSSLGAAAGSFMYSGEATFFHCRGDGVTSFSSGSNESYETVNHAMGARGTNGGSGVRGDLRHKARE